MGSFCQLVLKLFTNVGTDSPRKWGVKPGDFSLPVGFPVLVGGWWVKCKSKIIPTFSECLLVRRGRQIEYFLVG